MPNSGQSKLVAQRVTNQVFLQPSSSWMFKYFVEYLGLIQINVLCKSQHKIVVPSKSIWSRLERVGSALQPWKALLQRSM